MTAVSVENITKRYGKTVALDGVGFEVEKGELFGIIGPDGAGKTTLFRIIATLILADSGTASVDGFDVVRDYKEASQTHRLYARTLLALSGPHRRGESLVLRRGIRDDHPGELPPRGGHLQTSRTVPQATGGKTLRRHETETRALLRPHPQARHPLPRRTDHGRGPRIAQGVLGDAGETPAGGYHHRGLHPLHGRGQPVRPHRPHQRGTFPPDRYAAEHPAGFLRSPLGGTLGEDAPAARRCTGFPRSGQLLCLRRDAPLHRMRGVRRGTGCAATWRDWDTPPSACSRPKPPSKTATCCSQNNKRDGKGDGHTCRRSDQTVRQLHGSGPHIIRCGPRGGLRIPRCQRRGQDHRNAHALRPEPSHFGNGHGGGIRHHAAARKDKTEHRLHEPEILPVRRPEGVGEHPALRRHIRHEGCRNSPENRRTARKAGLHARAEHHGTVAPAGMETEASPSRSPSSTTRPSSSSTSPRAAWTPTPGGSSGR